MELKNQQIGDIFKRERSRLKNFIRKKVSHEGEAEDILQDVFMEFVNAFRLPDSIEQTGAWLFRVTKNRIIDYYRKKKEVYLEPEIENSESEVLWLEDQLLSTEKGPDSLYDQTILFEMIEEGLNELPKEQRDVFIAHEIEGLSFKEMNQETGLSVNTLLARKRYAVLYLREKLKSYVDPDLEL
jgi:RNA polymerase sigma factor (sigma-70 family)